MRKEKQKRTPSFKVVLVASILLLCFWVALNCFTTFSIVRDRRVAEGQYEVDRAIARLEVSLNRMEVVLDSLADQVSDFLTTKDLSHAEIEVWLRTQLLRVIRTVDKSYVNFSLARKGWFACGNNWVPPLDYKPENKRYFIEAFASPNKTSFIPPHMAPDNQHIKVSAVRLLPDGETVCLLCMDTDGFAPVISDAFESNWNYSFFIAPDNTVVARKNEDLSDIVRDKRFLKLLLSHGKGAFEYRSKTFGSDNDLMVISSDIKDGWRAVVIQNRGLFFAPVRKVLIENVLIAIIVFLLLSFFLHRIFVWVDNQQKDRLSAVEEQLRLKTLLAEEAQIAEKAKSTFLATMSHEIRTPINSIVGFAEFLKDKAISESEKESYINGIFKSSNALLALINNVLDLSKLESGNMNVRGGSCSLTKLGDEMFSIFHPLAKKKGVIFTSKVELDVPTCVALREERMRQILMNLIGNAVKFTAEGTVKFEAFWAKDEETGKGTLTLKVTDTGLGIGPSQFKDLFNPFKQDGGVRGGKVYQSTGLGLPICKRLVEAAGGTISFESTVNKGTSFIVTFPDVEKAMVDPSIVPEGAEVIATKPEDFKDLRVMIVDDVPLNLMIASRQVSLKGVSKECVKTFVNPNEAIEFLKTSTEEINVIFTDVWMPQMSGETFAKAVREGMTAGEIKGEKIIIFALTADSENSFDASLFDSVLLKPVTGVTIAEALKKASLLLKGT